MSMREGEILIFSSDILILKITIQFMRHLNSQKMLPTMEMELAAILFKSDRG